MQVRRDAAGSGRARARVAQTLAAAGALATLGLMDRAAGSGARSAAWWLGATPFIVWALAPFVLAAVLAGCPGSGPGTRIGVVLVCAAATFVYADTVLWHSDAQGAIAFVTVPFLQLLGSLAVFAAACVLGGGRRGGTRPGLGLG